MWELQLATRYGTGEAVERIGPFATLQECFEYIHSGFTPEQIAKQTEQKCWVWAAIGEETQEHIRQRMEVSHLLK